MKEKIYNLIKSMETHVEAQLLNTLKSYFGNEYVFMDCDDYFADTFLKKYDKSYPKYFRKTFNGFRLIPSSHVTQLDLQTYMYVKIENSLNRVNRQIYIYIFGKNMKKYSHALDIIMQTNPDHDNLHIYNVEGSLYLEDDSELKIIRSKLIPRDIETVFFSNGEKERICNHIDRFLNQESFYLNRQILYKTGILLYGKPGTGKTSLIKTLATKYNRSIININVSKLCDINLDELTYMINCDKDVKYIVVFEDIDTLFLTRNENATREDKAVINKILQFLDSNTSPNNVIFIATTNHIELLDDALLREGRFDLKVKIEELTRETSYEFGNAFGLNNHIMDTIMNQIIDELNIDEKSNPNCFNQSKLQSHMLAKINHYSLEKAQYLYEQENE